MLMPTGGGKSLSYQVPALVQDKIGVVISPLIALMREQSDKLTQRGIQALSLGGLEPKQAQQRLRQFDFANGPGFILTSPERAETDGFLEYVLQRNRERVALVAIDEAHCISTWGHDFRPPYKSIPGFLDRAFGRGIWPPVLCLSATLDADSQNEVLTDFRMDHSCVVKSANMLRSNLSLSIETFAHNADKVPALTELADCHRGHKIIVYAHLKQNRKFGTRALAELLRSHGHRAAAFDADLPLTERDQVIEGFRIGSIDLVCATGAFGMGIDIPDIRGVIHFLLPESIEQYYQEAGRAGRDGGPAFGVLMYTPKNSEVREDMLGSAKIDVTTVQTLWDELIDSGKGTIKSVSPSLEFQGRERDYALFQALQKAGALELVARGPRGIKAFEAHTAEGTQFISTISAATRTGNFLAAFRRLGVDPAKGYLELFEHYARDDVRLIATPDNVLVFRVGALAPEHAASIAADFNARVARRLSQFHSFREIVETNNLDTALQARFG